MIGPVTYDTNIEVQEDPSTGKRGRDKSPELSGRSVKQLKHEDAVITISRRDAFVGGVLAYREFLQNVFEDLTDKQLEEHGLTREPEVLEEQEAGIKLSKSQYSEIEDVAVKKSGRVSSQLFEIYQILGKKRALKKQSGTEILNLANRLISKLEDKDVQPMDMGDIEPEFQEMAKKYTEMLGYDLPLDVSQGLAVELQRKMQQKGDGEEADPREKMEDLVSAQLGCLLLIASRDFANAALIAKLEDDDEIIDALADGVEAILEPIRLKILEKGEEFRAYSIQSPDEALFHQFSIELADLLLLDSGSINFGIIQDSVEYLMPEYFKDLTAVNTLHIVLEILEDTSELWKIISQCKPPHRDNLPGNLAVRVTLGLLPNEEITRRHAQLTVLSAFLGHFRQARAGTCFTTAPLIDVLFHHPDMFLSDMADLVEKGCITRMVLSEKREFPFQTTSSKDFLSTLITADNGGRILSTQKYELRVGEDSGWEGPYEDSFLYEAPGVLAVCKTLNINDPVSAVMQAMEALKVPFTPKQLIQEFAKIAFELQNEGFAFRSRPKYSIEELVNRGTYAFCSQTNHPLHRAYEQAVVSSVKYLGSKYGLSIRPFQILEKYLEGKDKGYSVEFQTRFRRLLQELLQPLITRMRYRYNHNFDDDIALFDDGNHGVESTSCYGYELCDAGLPKDFEYSTDLYQRIKQDCSFILIDRNVDVSSSHSWKLANTGEKFIAFLQDVIMETAEEMKRRDKTHTALWDSVCQKMCEIVSKKTLQDKMAAEYFPKQKSKFEKNPYTFNYTPWKLKMGGDFDEVLQTFYGFTEAPSKIKEFNGNQREVLAKCISWIKNQPEEFKQEFEDPRSQFLITSPVHAFLLTPHEASFRNAWESDMSSIDYIQNHVINPGLKIANSFVPVHAKRALVDYVANNDWAVRELEHHDFERQQLTDFSKQKFDEFLSEEDIENVPPQELLNTLWSVVVHSRAADPIIGTRNNDWERKCKLALQHKMDQVYTKYGDWKERLIDFARNRKDTIALSEKAVRRFKAKMQEKIEGNISYKDFRAAVLEEAYNQHCQDLCNKDSKWKENFCENFDTKIFKTMSGRKQKQLIGTGIVTHDPNWKREMNDYRIIWLVNPGTGNLEMCNYLPDLALVSFRGQKEWFPQGGEHGGWDFPDNYVAWKNGPLFNVKKLMAI